LIDVIGTSRARGHGPITAYVPRGAGTGAGLRGENILRQQFTNLSSIHTLPLQVGTSILPDHCPTDTHTHPDRHPCTVVIEAQLCYQIDPQDIGAFAHPHSNWKHTHTHKHNICAHKHITATRTLTHTNYIHMCTQTCRQ